VMAWVDSWGTDNEKNAPELWSSNFQLQR
jgi:hypothetical protein